MPKRSRLSEGGEEGSSKNTIRRLGMIANEQRFRYSMHHHKTFREKWASAEIHPRFPSLPAEEVEQIDTLRLNYTPLIDSLLLRKEEQLDEELKRTHLEVKVAATSISALADFLRETKCNLRNNRNCNLTTLTIDDSSKPFDPAEVAFLLQSLGPHMAHLQTPCKNKEQSRAVVSLMEGGLCPKEHLRIVSLTHTEELDEEAMEEFLALKTTTVGILYFSHVSSSCLNIFFQLGQQCPQLKQQSGDDVPSFIPFPPQWEFTAPIPVSQLPKGQLAFATADPTSFPHWVPICIPVDETKAKAHSQLLARMLEPCEDERDEPGEPRVVTQSVRGVQLVQLLVLYIEHVEAYPIGEGEELVPSFGLFDDYFLKHMEQSCNGDKRTMISTTLDLLNVSIYLQMPCLRRLMRSLLRFDESLMDSALYHHHSISWLVVRSPSNGRQKHYISGGPLHHQCQTGRLSRPCPQRKDGK